MILLWPVRPAVAWARLAQAGLLASRPAGTHSATFDKKVHKPDAHWTLAVTRVKRANHDEKQEKYLYLVFFYVFYIFCSFYPEAYNFS